MQRKKRRSFRCHSLLIGGGRHEECAFSYKSHLCQHYEIRSSISMTIMFLQLSPLSYMLAVDTPETSEDTQYARCESDEVGRPVTREPQLASALTIWFNYRVGVIDCTVKEIEDVSADDRCQSHEAPVDGEAIGTECINDERRKDAE